MASSSFRVVILTERGNCLFDHNPSSLKSTMETKDLCRLLASLATLSELDDFRLMRTETDSMSVLPTQIWTIRRGEVLWSYASAPGKQSETVKLVLLKMFVTFIRNCPVLERIVDTERVETQRVGCI